MHIDLNSCFATIEQQANPFLRGRPIAVAAYDSPSGCILAPSIEAKKLGIKVGMRVKEGKLICPDLQIFSPDPNKYRSVHLALKKLLHTYTDSVTPKSIDEFVLNFEGYPSFKLGMPKIGNQIKSKIKSEIGDWLTVSIGIGPNRFLAKQAAGLKKPDGLEEINYQNYQSIYSKLTLTDITGINQANASRLNSRHIYTVMDFYNSTIYDLRSAFKSITSYYWYLRLRGWEIDDVDFGRKSFGNMYSLPKAFSDPSDLAPILHKLVEKTSFRLRTAGYQTRGIHLGILYKDHSFWHHGHICHSYIFDSADIYKRAFRILTSSPYRQPVANISVSCFDLLKSNNLQLDLFQSIDKKNRLAQAIDKINLRYGQFVITPAMMLQTGDLVPDRISFGGIGEVDCSD